MTKKKQRLPPGYEDKVLSKEEKKKLKRKQTDLINKISKEDKLNGK